MLCIGSGLLAGPSFSGIPWDLRVLSMFLVSIFRLSAGVALGGALLYTTVRLVQGMLYRISAFDPVTLTAVIALLTVVTFVAGFVPALRASRG